MLSRRKSQGRAWIGALALVLLVAAAFARTLSNDFVGFDTGTYLTDHEHVSAGLTWPGVQWAFTTFHAANWHPLTWISHMIDVSLFGLRPAPHHAVNVAFHAANSVLVFLLLWRWTARPGLSFAVAALFAVHPLHVESVAWIVERKDVLSAFFGLASLLAWTNWARRRSRAAYVLALLLFAAALMSKPMLVTLPFALLVFDVWPLQRKVDGWKPLIVEKLPFLALTVLSCVLTWRAQSSGGAMQSAANLPFAERLCNAVASPGWYVAKALWPTNLAFHYALHLGRDNAPYIAWGAIVLVSVTGLAIAQRRTRPWILAGWSIFLGMLVPVIGFVQVGGQAHADRYMYLPILGLLVATIWTASDLIPHKPAQVALTTLVVATLAFLTSKQVATWKDDAALARHALEVDPDNAVAHDVLGWTLFRQGQVKDGLAHLKRALELEPGDPDARRNAARALLQLGRLDEAESAFRMAIANGARDPQTFLEFAQVLALRGETVEALTTLSFAVTNAPDRADLRTTYGELLHQAGNHAQAEAELRAAIALAPRYPRAQIDLARLLIDLDRLQEAEPYLRHALALDASSPQASQQLARILLARGDEAGAINALRAAIAARAQWPVPMADLAWILSTARNATLRSPTEALDLATRAADLGNRERPEFLDVLAAAQAANGNFEEAERTASEAAQRADQAGNSMLAARIQERLQAYRHQQMGEGPR
jgi:Flp pilus assembly protein TadD